MNKLARWVPAIVAPIAVVGAAIAIPAVASAEGPLPAKTPQQVLELIAKSDTAAYSGTVTQSSDLGLPDLTALEGQAGPAGASGNGLMDLLTASHTAKVYTDGDQKQRLQLLDTLAERDVVRNGDGVWLYDSAQHQAEHVTVSPADAGKKASAPDVTPAQLAAQLVDQLTPSTDFAVSTQDRVAGRSVYRLTLTPKTDGTLVEDATVAVDAHTGVPLEVSVYATGQSKPAATVAFTKISYGKPAASVFDFTPPQGTQTDTRKLTPGDASTPAPAHGLPADAPKPTVVGSGWDAIAELPAGSLDPAQLGGATTGGGQDASALLGLLQKVDGGRGAQTSLVSVLITDDGRVLAGAVPLSALEAAAK
ncbi:MAG TPA: sigma-E factor regulatory protein RseB domain-containing protein [Gryllotalpicola sp.]